VVVGREARVHRVLGLARLVGPALVAGLVLVLTGCASPSYRFIGSDDRDLVLRVPRDWTVVDTGAALKAAGLDPAAQPGWTAFIDGSPRPDVKHVGAASDEDPLLFAETIPLTKEQRAGVTGDALRELVLPGDPDIRAAAAKAKAFAILENKVVSTPTQQGVHIKYSFKIGDTKEIFDEIALADPKLTRVQLVFVHCTEACYAEHAAEISAVVSSLTLKST
jgi:hypothetical protein